MKKFLILLVLLGVVGGGVYFYDPGLLGLDAPAKVTKKKGKKKKVAKAPKKALLIIGTNDSNQNVLALTNLKLNGYSIAVGAGYEVAATQDAGDVLVSEMSAQTYELSKRYAATASKRS